MARKSTFNKFLNFIGLVDEQDDRYPDDYDQGRPSGASTYNPPARRGQQSGGARPMRAQDYDDGRYPPQRYDTRPNYNRYDNPPAREREYNAQPGRDYAYPRDGGTPQGYAGTSRYQGGGRGGARAEYERASQRADYNPRYRSQPGDSRSALGYDAGRTDYYGQRAQTGRDQAPQAMPRQMDMRDAQPRDNVVSMRSSGRSETMIFYLHQLEECRDVITALLDNKTVLLNLEDMDERLIQRGIDTLCGAAFALNATLRKASDKTYLIAPNTVTVATSSDERY